MIKLVEDSTSDVDLNLLCLLKVPTLQHVGLLSKSVFCGVIRRYETFIITKDIETVGMDLDLDNLDCFVCFILFNLS